MKPKAENYNHESTSNYQISHSKGFWYIDPSILHMAYHEKASEKVEGILNNYKDFIECIKGCVWASDSVNEFKDY